MKKNYFIIVFFNLLIVFFVSKFNVFGSTMDFLNQHIVFPDYLRNTFYETGKIIPSTITIGGVQNIYNIAYYGLLNPIILFSYFFPFIRMVDYIVISNIVLLLLSNVLFYRFVKDKFSNFTVFFVTFLFMFSGPLIFQFHRHFMFVNYMPFLILALINIDKKRNVRLILDIIFIIMTSFYYSIVSIVAIVIYYIYKNGRFKNLILILLIPLLVTAVLTLPTFCAILNTRVSSDVSLFSFLVPDLNFDNLLYGAYCPGLSSILIVSLVYLLQTRKKKNIMMVVVIAMLSFFPFVLVLLNGGLYVRPKVLIPLLPILVYIIGVFIDDLVSGKVDVKSLVKLVLLVNLFALINYHVLVFYLDLLFTLVLVIVYYRFKSNKILVGIVLLNFVICVCLNCTENFITYDLYNEVSVSYDFDTTYRTSVLSNSNYVVNRGFFTPSIYSSTVNKYYKNFYNNVFRVEKDTINDLELTGTRNVLFNEYMGVKYVVSDDDLGYPYKRVGSGVYELGQALPIGYVNTNTVNREYYESLEYPYYQDVFLNYVVVDDGVDYVKSNISKIDLKYTYELGEGIDIRDGKIYVTDDSSISVYLKNDLKGKILFIEIPNQVEQNQDIVLTINGQRNVLTSKDWIYPNKNNTFYYCIEGTNFLDIELSKGVYDVSLINTYVLDNDFLVKDVDSLEITDMSSEVIKGNINVTKSGYFVLSIPYDEGFKIRVNGKNQDYEIINDCFIGFFIDEGFYDIEVTYIPPLFNEGKFVSAIGILLFIVVIKKNVLDC